MMRSILLGLLTGLVAINPSLAIEQQGKTFTLDDEEMAACQAGGGCVVIPAVLLDRIVKAARSCSA